MKTALYLLIIIFVSTIAAVSCDGTRENELQAIDKAEEAFGAGRYSVAQSIADSLMLREDLHDLGISELCRLSLLFIRLGESSGNEEANTALAARALGAAFDIDSDSTGSYIRNVAVDDRARMALVSAITTARVNGDSIITEPDSLIY